MVDLDLRKRLFGAGLILLAASMGLLTPEWFTPAVYASFALTVVGAVMALRGSAIVGGTVILFSTIAIAYSPMWGTVIYKPALLGLTLVIMVGSWILFAIGLFRQARTAPSIKGD